MRILDVGCGQCKFKGSVGIDMQPLDGVDVVHDLNSFPWPFKENYFDRVIFKHSLAHLDDILRVMEEVHRIGRDGAIVEIITPHFSSDNYFTDITHKHPMGYRSMNYVCQNIESWKYKYTNVNFDLMKVYISFGEVEVDFNLNENRRRTNLHRVLGFEYLANKAKRIYEKFFCFMITANTVYFSLEIVKR